MGLQHPKVGAETLQKKTVASECGNMRSTWGTTMFLQHVLKELA